MLNKKMIRIKSRALKGNKLNDSDERDILVFYPDHVDHGILFIELAGLNGTPKLNNRFSEIITKLYKNGKIENSVIINPDFSTRFHVNQYMNSPEVGNYEDFIINEIIPEVSEMFHTDKTVLFGKSSGGFGAYNLAVRHSDIINGFADHFGDSCFEYVYIPDIPVAYKYLKNKSIDDFISETSGKSDISDDEIRTLNIIGMSAFYSYNDHGFDLPFDNENGSFKNDVWNRWIYYDPAKNIEKYLNELRRLSIYMDVGLKDEYNLFIGLRTMHSKLLKNNIEHCYLEFNGGHFGNSKRYEFSLPYFVERFKNTF
ncbi:hypothetical hydrolase [Picrophilus oshimae DSM 9789]|uniref:Hypothetical hydrolase n=2 Tax=Picrophilus oshimae TaxID=46632 RepID=Q6L189_PICTO|nr:hypothetical hydrolase [Picrophilus oshimae DSM 9789]